MPTYALPDAPDQYLWPYLGAKSRSVTPEYRQALEPRSCPDYAIAIPVRETYLAAHHQHPPTRNMQTHLPEDQHLLLGQTDRYWHESAMQLDWYRPFWQSRQKPQSAP